MMKEKIELNYGNGKIILEPQSDIEILNDEEENE